MVGICIYIYSLTTSRVAHHGPKGVAEDDEGLGLRGRRGGVGRGEVAKGFQRLRVGLGSGRVELMIDSGAFYWSIDRFGCLLQPCC